MIVNRELVGRRVRWIRNGWANCNDMREHPRIGDEGVTDLVVEGDQEYLVVEWDAWFRIFGATQIDVAMFGIDVELVEFVA